MLHAFGHSKLPYTNNPAFQNQVLLKNRKTEAENQGTCAVSAE